MPDPAAVDALVRAGGWTLFVTTVALIGAGAVRGWWVPGWIYRRAERRSERIEAALDKLTDALAARRDA